LLALGLTSALAQSPLLLLEEKVPAPDYRLSYGSNELNFGELRLPKGSGPYPVVVLIHGGCWKARLEGLDPRATSLDLLRPMAAALTESRMATWNIEYRRVGNEGGGWPGTFQDVGQSIDFLRSISEKHSLDLKRVIVAGHSAGGQLAFWAAARPKLSSADVLYSRQPLPLKAVIDLDGPIDLKAGERFTGQFCGFPAIQEFLGGSPDRYPDRYRAGSASSFLPLGVQQEIIVGSLLGGIKDQVESYSKEAKSKGDKVAVLDLEQGGHFGFLFPRSEYWKPLLERFKASSK
jgi:acetyl esterase/lipase